MLNYNSTIKDEIKLNELSIREISPIMKLNIRGRKREFFTSVGKNINILLPTEANTSSTSDKITAVWLSPDEWMIFSNEETKKNSNKYEIEELLYKNISRVNLGAVTDVTDQFVLLELKGKKIFELFASGSPFNFKNFKEKKGSTTQTLLNHIDVIIHHKNENLVNLFVRRSFSEHLWSWLNDSSKRL